MRTNFTIAVALVGLGVLSAALNFGARRCSNAFAGGVEGRPLVLVAMVDWAWLKVNLAWERRDTDAVRGLSEVCVTLAANEPYFRMNAARMRAFDLPAWREAAEPTAPAAAVQRWRSEAGREALAFLAERDDGSAEHAIEAGAIALYASADVQLAARYFGVAAARPNAPWFAGRVYAELLHRAGRTREAVEWLRAWSPRIPAGTAAAERTLAERRLAELERALGGG